ncbi:hypothetical protein [Streptomyces bauhiniae]|uniref:Uncharacterized protein n=1 Tax=Streptomyces bauhiniae TaxID=2340725 RepID=A0A7K3R165_9ACTN|nr:hypothetical protein [Streptomyces bauhiniae]NEB95815.1 hypothetical protein [Streptomyces bauhiniae]
MNDSQRPQQEALSGLDRRGVMRGATQLGLAGLAAGVVLGAAEPAMAAAPRLDEAVAQAPAEAAGPHEPLVVHVRNASKGELDFFHGERHHHVVDRELAAALLRHTR